MPDSDQEQLREGAGQTTDEKLPEMMTCGKCNARLSEILNFCPECGMAIVKDNKSPGAVASKVALADLSLYSVRHLILQTLAEKNEMTYARTIAQRLAQHGIAKERILIELNKLTNSGHKPIKRVKASYPFQRKFLYTITENGIAELKRRNDIISKQETPAVDQPPLDPYLWLLESLIEPMTVDDLTGLRGDSRETLQTYLSQLYRLGAIEKHKQPEEKDVSQRNRNGDIITRKTTTFRTYYQMKDGPLREKMAQGVEFTVIGKPAPTFKVDVPIEASGAKEPVFSAEEEEKYQKWRENTRDMEEFHKQILKRANKAGMRPTIAYRLVFKQLLDNGKI